MKTKSSDKIEKAKQLLTLIKSRKEIEKAESELKDYFKAEITDGVLEAGNIVIMLEDRQRTSLDRTAMEQAFGADKIKKFEKITYFQQVNVEEKKSTEKKMA